MIFFYAVSFCAGEAAAVSSSSSSSSGWTLAAVEFSFSQMKNRTESSSEAAKVLPQLILERISSVVIRQVPETEILDRKLKDLQTERLALFLQLSKENQARDALVLTTADSKKLRKLIKAEDEKIAEIEKQIKENLENAEKEIDESQKMLNRRNLLEKMKSRRLRFLLENLKTFLTAGFPANPKLLKTLKPLKLLAEKTAKDF